MLFLIRQFQAYEQFQQTAETAPCPQALIFALRPYLILFRHGSSCTSRLIGQPFANHTSKQFFGAFGVIHAHRLAVAVPEIEFS